MPNLLRSLIVLFNDESVIKHIKRGSHEGQQYLKELYEGVENIKEHPEKTEEFLSGIMRYIQKSRTGLSKEKSVQVARGHNQRPADEFAKLILPHILEAEEEGYI